MPGSGSTLRTQNASSASGQIEEEGGPEHVLKLLFFICPVQLVTVLLMMGNRFPKQTTPNVQ